MLDTFTSLFVDFCPNQRLIGVFAEKGEARIGRVIWKDIAAVVIGPTLLVTFYFRIFFLSHGAMLYGNEHDPSFINVIHEYLYQAILRHQSLRNLPFFFPAKDVVGYSDAFMLNMPIYSLLRIAGFDPFVSFECLLMLLVAIGFAGFYLVIRLLLRLQNALLASAGAAVATMPSNFVIEAIGLGHANQFAEYFLVWGALLSLLPMVRRDLFVDCVGRTRFCIALGGFIFGLSFATLFYSTWFFGLYAIIIVAVTIALLWLEGRLSAAIKYTNRPALGWWAAGILPGLIVFAYLYLDALITLGTRPVDAYLWLAHTPADVFNVGKSEFLWGQLFPIQHMWSISTFNQAGHSFAMTPILLLSCAASATYWRRQCTEPILRSLVFAACVGMVAVFLLTSRYGDFTPFEFIRWILPGAGAIRVGMRSQIIASSLAALIVTVTAAHLLATVKTRFAKSIVWCGVGLITAEQINTIDLHFRRHDTLLAMMASTPAPPDYCKVVYFTGHRPTPGPDQFQGAVRAVWEYNAMWRALSVHKPTIDGASGWYPPGWNLAEVDDAQIDDAARDWAKRSGVQDLCGFDVEAARWQKMD